MFTKTGIVVSTALILGAATLSPALAMRDKTPVKTSVMQSFVHSIDDSNDVYVNGQYVGSDPDARVRWTILKEAREKVGN